MPGTDDPVDDLGLVVDQPSGIAIDELSRLVRAHRGRQSIRKAADDAGVSFSTMSRVEAGAQPDLTTFLQLCAWIGIAPERFFRPSPKRLTSTVDEVISHLFADPRLSSDAAERIAGVVRDLYSALAKEAPQPRPLTMHLRAASAMRPGVPERLGSLLHDMRVVLEERIEEGSL